MPLIADLDTAMMQPAVSVPAVRQLGGGTIRLDSAHRPLRTAGRDAVVYELATPSGRIVALRAHLRPDVRRDSMLTRHYAALRDDPHLASLRGPAGPLPANVQWFADGVALPGPDLHRLAIPLLAMERVPGWTLARTIDRLCREGNTLPLALLADEWLKTATMLEHARFIHGDLAADNLMVRPDGTLAVIDLDTAHWPALLAPVPPGEGSPGYVHPRGMPRQGDRRDRFPALVLWASLRILARHPELRQRWGDHPDRFGAALLWSADDLRRPERSPLFAAIAALRDDALRPLLDVMRRAIQFGPDDTPPLSEIAERLDGMGFPRLATPAGRAGRRPLISGDEPAPSGEPQTPAPSFTPLVRRPGDNAPDTVTTPRLDRERRRAAAQRLAAAVAGLDVAEAVQLWEVHRETPEVATHAVAVHQLVADDVTTAIERALRRRDDQGLVSAVRAAERSGVAVTAEVRAAARVARERISTRRQLDDAIAHRDYDVIARLKVCGQLDALGRLDPALERAVARAMAWPALHRALAGDDDVAIVAAADPALWREEESLPAEAWQRLDLARRRVRWLEDVRAALRERDGPVLRSLLAAAPEGAEARLTEIEGRRILRVTMREAAVARLERALRLGPDREVVEALAEVETAGAPFSDVLDWAAVRGVVDRISLADALRAAAASDPPDTALLARLLPAARAALGTEGTAGPDWAELERAVLRAAHLARLREAISSARPEWIASAADPDPYGTLALLSAEEREQVERSLQAARRSAAG